MKTILTGILCLLTPFILFAQKDIPAFGKIDKAELDMKQCEYDKAAEAMVLFDVAEVYCYFNLNSMHPITSEIQRHVRIKIFDKRGLDYANVRIRYLGEKDAERIKNISAQTTNVDEAGNVVVTKLDKKLIYDKKINKRISEIVFAFPDVKPGSILEYKYKDEADDIYALRNWYFQKTIPVKQSKYIIDFPYELKIAAQPKGSFDLNIDQKNEGNRNIKTYSMTNIPALRDEPYITCDEDYLQQVIPYVVSLEIPGELTRNLQRTWPGIIKQLMEDEDFGVQLKKNIPRTSELDALLRNVSDPFNKMAIIHEYVRKNMEWNNTNGIWALEGVKSAWRDKKGTTGEINLILVNLLKDANLKASPILLSTRENGRINTSIAGFDQFNKVMAHVTINGKSYVLDASNKLTPANLIPTEVLFTEGLIIEKLDTYEWGWKILADNEHAFNSATNVEAIIDDNGVMKGEAQVISSDYSRLLRAPVLKEGKEAFIKTYFPPAETNLQVESLTLENEGTDSLPLVQTLKFSQPVSSSGGYNYFTANLFSGLEKNPFLADSRFSDVFFGAKQEYVIDGNFTIPKDFSFDALPKNMRMRLPDNSIMFTRTSNVVDKTLTVRLKLEFSKPVYTRIEYDGLHEFYKKLYVALNEQFVYKKN